MRERASDWAFRAACIAVLLLVVVSAPASGQTLQITSPASGTQVNPGQTLGVTVVDTPTGSFSQVVIIGEDPIGFSQVLTSTPYQFSIQIPQTIALGTYALTAVGVQASGGEADSDPIVIDVEPTANLVSVQVAPSILSFTSVGAQVPLGVTGSFSDGSTADVTESTQTTYSSTSLSVASVSTSGLVTAVGPGSAYITVDGFFNVPVIVAQPTPSPAPPATPTATPAPTPTPIAPGGTLSLSTHTLSFGAVKVGQVKELSFKITNTGKKTLDGDIDLSALTSPLSLVSGGGGFTLKHNQARSVTIQVKPGAVGSFSGIVTIFSGALKKPVQTVTAKGRGKK